MAFGRHPGKPRRALGATELYEYAVKALGSKMRSESELRRKLAGRAEEGEEGEAAVDAVVLRLKERGYLNDAAFAETYARLRQTNEKLGARRVMQDLRQKGVAAGLATEAVEARYGETDEETLARAHLERKRIGKPGTPQETARVMRRLVAAGFSTGVIYKILRQWDVPEETLGVLENLAEEAHEE